MHTSEPGVRDKKKGGEKSSLDKGMNASDLRA